MNGDAALRGDRAAARRRKTCVERRPRLSRLALGWLLGLFAATCAPRPIAPVVEARAATAETIPSLVALNHRDPSRLLRGDWEPPQTLLLAYEDDWAHVLGELIAAAQVDAPVLVVLKPEHEAEPRVRQWLRALEVEHVTLAHDSPWIRDYGPFELLDESGSRRWLDLGYDATRPLDDLLPEQLGRVSGMVVEHHALMLDGGGMISNGEGHCVMTDTSFIAFSGAQSFELTADALERLGCRVLTVVPALPEEDTGHIDVVAQFLSSSVVAVAQIDEDQRPSDAQILDRTAQLLVMGAEHLGQHLRVIRVPLFVADGIYYSYINGTRLRRRFLVPSYVDVPESFEELAYRRLRSGLGDRVELTPVVVDELARLGGAIHCVTLGLSTRVVAGAPPDAERIRYLPATSMH